VALRRSVCLILAWAALVVMLPTAVAASAEGKGLSPAELIPADAFVYVEGRALGVMWRSFRSGVFYERLRSEGLLEPLGKTMKLSAPAQQANVQLALDIVGRHFAFCQTRRGVKILLLQVDPAVGSDMSLMMARMIMPGSGNRVVDSHTYEGVEILHCGDYDSRWLTYQGHLADDWVFAVYSTDPEDAHGVIDRWVGKSDVGLARRLDSFDCARPDAGLVFFADIDALRGPDWETVSAARYADAPEPIRTFLRDITGSADSFCAVLAASDDGVSVAAELAVREERLSPFTRSVLSAFGGALAAGTLVPSSLAVGLSASLDTSVLAGALDNLLPETGKARDVLLGLADGFFDGRDILREIAPLVGPEIAFYVLPREGQVPETALCFRLRNSGAERIFDDAGSRLVEKIGELQTANEASPGFDAGCGEVAGHSVYYVTPPRGATNPTGEKVYLGVVNGLGVVSLSEAGIRRAAEFADSGGVPPVEGAALVRVDISRLLELAVWFAKADGKDPEATAERFALARQVFSRLDPVRLVLQVQPSRISGNLSVLYVRPHEAHRGNGFAKGDSDEDEG